MAGRIARTLLVTGLLLLAAPAFASACSLATTTTYTGSGTWETAANWFPSGNLPLSSDRVCIPLGSAVTLGSASAIQDIELEGSLSVNTATLTVGSPSAVGSTIAGNLTVDTSTLELNTNTDWNAGLMTLTQNSVVLVDATRQLQLNNGVDAAEGAGLFNKIQVNGDIRVNSSGANPSQLQVGLQVDGTGGNSGPLLLTGGGQGTGDWQLGSGTGPDEPTLTISGGNFGVGGSISDAASGGLGHVVINDGSLSQSAVDSQLHVFALETTSATAVLDISNAGAGTASAEIGYAEISGGSTFEVDVPLTAQSIVARDGAMLMNGPWNAQYLHFGGGALNSTTQHGGPLTVATLDLGKDGIDTGARAIDKSDLVVTGAGTGDYQYANGTLDMTNGGDLTLGSGVRLVLGGDVDIQQTSGAGKIINHGAIVKQVDLGAGSNITPVIDMPDGAIEVKQGTLSLGAAPVQYNGVDSLLGGTYLLSGTLQFPGPVTVLGAGISFENANAQLLNTLTGLDARETATRNASGSTLTFGSGSALQPTNDFTNEGTINVTGTALITLAAGKNFFASPGSVTNLGSPASGITLTGGSVQLAGGVFSGIGIVDGDLENSAGTLAPGNSPGTLTINGNFTQLPGGTLVEEIAGFGPFQFDLLNVTGTANLDGTLHIVNFGGFDPVLRQSASIVTAGARNGTFANVVQPPAGLWYSASYGSASAGLVVNGVSVQDTAAAEGSNAGFPIALDSPEASAVSVDWATAPGSASASDFTPSSGTVTFAPGETAKTIALPITADGVAEPDEDFSVTLSNPVGTRIARGAATGSIPNNLAGAGTAVSPDDIDGFAKAPPPVQGKRVNVAPVSGQVLVKLPGTKKFVPLPDEEQVPVGTIVDTRKGVVRLFSVGKRGKIQSAIFYQGVFQVLQKVGQALTREKLVGESFAGCPKARRADASAKKRKRLGPASSVGHLWGSGAGEFRTEGRYATASIRGTKWLTDDRCNGTLIRVTVGAVTVRDLTRKKTIILRKPKSYLAPATR